MLNKFGTLDEALMASFRVKSHHFPKTTGRNTKNVSL